MLPTAVVSRRGADRVRAGHPWIYRSDVAEVEAEPGALVRVVTERDRRLGWALWSSASQIALRMVSTTEVADERVWLRDRLSAAIAYRRTLAIGASAYRLVHGESDLLPGLIVDRYADARETYLVVQALCQGMDRRLAEVVELLVELTGARGVLARNDPKVRRLEGLAESVDVVYGDVPDRIEVSLGAATFSVDVRHGQKTGLFLDQRENHEAAARYAHGRALDAFTYNGGFALPLSRTCDSVLALDSSAQAVAATRENAARNAATNVLVREANVFDELRELEVSGERFETIVLDPPAFAKNRAAVQRALAGYKEINLRAFKLLAARGHLITCSCSYNVSEDLFIEVLGEAAADARVAAAVVEKRQQARDHPVLLNVPETHYLKCVVLRRVA